MRKIARTQDAGCPFQGGTMMRRLVFIISICLFYPCVTLAIDATVGSIKAVKGTASIIRNRNPIEAKTGTMVFRNDSLKTGTDGSMSMIFRDDTLLAIGPNSELKVKEFQFSPEKENSLCCKTGKGNRRLHNRYHRQTVPGFRAV
jgi:hypothetical protein